MNGGTIELAGVSTAYEGSDLPVIRGISFSIAAGDFVVVGGPNGAGKTTLLETVNGMLPITHGRATVCGLDVAASGTAVRKRVGYVIQNFAFDPLAPFTVGHVVIMGRYGILAGEEEVLEALADLVASGRVVRKGALYLLSAGG